MRFFAPFLAFSLGCNEIGAFTVKPFLGRDISYVDWERIAGQIEELSLDTDSDAAIAKSVEIIEEQFYPQPVNTKSVLRLSFDSTVEAAGPVFDSFAQAAGPVLVNITQSVAELVSLPNITQSIAENVPVLVNITQSIAEFDIKRSFKQTFPTKRQNAIAAVLEAGNATRTSVDPFLYGSSQIYQLAELRKLIRDKRTAHKLNKTELLLQEGNSDSPIQNRSFQERITAASFYEFIQENKEFLSRELKGAEFNSLFFVNASSDLTLSDQGAFVYHFDDDLSANQPVYGIAVNQAAQRITVVFRGTVTGGADWKTNIKVDLKEIETPKRLLEIGLDPNKRIKVHRGFKEYLFGVADKKNGESKYDQIVKKLTELYNDPTFKDYKLHVVGHSLGAALATLFAFRHASDGHLERVTCISFASPYVGGQAWNEAFQVLEKNGTLKHLRVSNEKDIVPVLPPSRGSFFGLVSPAGYTHTGVNLHLKEKKDTHTGVNLHLKEKKDKGDAHYENGYRNLKTTISQWKLPLSFEHHSLTDYYNRNRDLPKHDIDDLYKKHFKVVNE